jgi:hypothetical protein
VSEALELELKKLGFDVKRYSIAPGYYGELTVPEKGFVFVDVDPVSNNITLHLRLKIPAERVAVVTEVLKRLLE